MNSNLQATIDEPMSAYSNEIDSMATAAENVGGATTTIFRRRCRQDLQLVMLLHRLDPSCDFDKYGNATTLVWDDTKLTTEIAQKWLTKNGKAPTNRFLLLACI